MLGRLGVLNAFSTYNILNLARFTRTELHREAWGTRSTDTPDATKAPQVRSTFPPFLICNSFSDSDKLALIIYNEFSYLFTVSIHVN